MVGRRGFLKTLIAVALLPVAALKNLLEPKPRWNHSLIKSNPRWVQATLATTRMKDHIIMRKGWTKEQKAMWKDWFTLRSF